MTGSKPKAEGAAGLSGGLPAAYTRWYDLPVLWLTTTAWLASLPLVATTTYP
jgi:hypothetical protein